MGDGRLRVPLERRVQNIRVPNVRFLGFRRDVPAVLGATDVGVLPSKREGLPRSVLEALAAGLPVVATDVRGNRDLIEPGTNGLAVCRQYLPVVPPEAAPDTPGHLSV